MYLRTRDLIIMTVEAFSGGRLITVFYFDIKTSGRLTVGNFCTKIFLNSPTNWRTEKPWWGCMWTSCKLFFSLAFQSVSLRCGWAPPAHLNMQQRLGLCSEYSIQVPFFSHTAEMGQSFQPVFLCKYSSWDFTQSVFSPSVSYCTVSNDFWILDSVLIKSEMKVEISK